MTKLRKWLITLLSKILSESLSKIVVDTIFGVAVPTALLVSFWGYILDLAKLISSLLLEKVPAYFLLLSFVFPIILYFVIKYFNKPKYFFFDYDGVKWKANKRTGEINSEPYCLLHQVQLVWDRHESYYCPVDGQRKDLPTKYDIVDTRKGAQNVAKAIIDQHIKNASIQKSKV